MSSLLSIPDESTDKSKAAAKSQQPSARGPKLKHSQRQPSSL